MAIKRKTIFVKKHRRYKDYPAPMGHEIRGHYRRVPHEHKWEYNPEYDAYYCVICGARQ